MILAHKIALDPTVKQQKYFAMAAGTVRFVWNWGLAEWDNQYKAGLKPSGTKLKKEFNAIKYAKFPWLEHIHRDAHSRPFANLQSAFSKFFKKTSKHPQFKKKGVHDSFYVANDKLSVRGKTIRLPVIGVIRMREALRFSGKIMGAVVSRTADKWFVSIQVDMADYCKPRVSNKQTGIDLGINHLATMFDGVSSHKVEGPKPLKRLMTKLVRLSKHVSRKQKGSCNRKKATGNLARFHARIASVRLDALHKLTTNLCRENQAVVIEDLNVQGMLKNHRLARVISDMGFGEFRRQLGYKSKIYGTNLTFADRWFPSTKTCSRCGAVKESMSLSERVFRCDLCGLVIDRDENAARNLHTLGLRGINACGEARSSNALAEAGTRPCACICIHPREHKKE